MSCVFQNIDPPPPPTLHEYPRLCCGGRTHSPGGRGVGVNILEDARHSFVLYLYWILFGLSHLNFHSLHCVPHIRYVLLLRVKGTKMAYVRTQCIFYHDVVYLTVWICIQYSCSSSAEAVRILEHFVSVLADEKSCNESKIDESFYKWRICLVKGSLTRDFDFRFFPWIRVPRALRIPLGLFRFCSKIRGDIREWMFVTGVPRGQLIHEKKHWHWKSLVRLSLIDNPSSILRQIIPLIFFYRCRHNISM